MRITQEMRQEALEYMRQWIQDDKWDDLSVMYNAGEDEIMADHLVSAGAINSRMCYEEAKYTEKIIEELAKRFRKFSYKKQNKIRDLIFKNVFINSCNDCNNVSFVEDKNEKIYPELQTQCWECKSKNIETYIWNERK